MDSTSWIDLRSDTVTQPSIEMRHAMSIAEVGDDVYGEDPTVALLESTLAERAGMEAGLFMPTGTQSNLVALLTHCGRGDEYIVGQQAHTYKYEGGGAAAFGGIQPQPLEFNASGGLDLSLVAAAIKPPDIHFAKTRLLCLENTMQGKVLPLSYLQDAHDFAMVKGLALHLDGARVFNAAVAAGVELSVITKLFDTVSICLSKGLGAPVGSVLLGSKDFIAVAKRWRKVAGGGMRQAGILAAAGLYALRHNVERLADDHSNALKLSQGLNALGFAVEPVQTNMVFIDCGERNPQVVVKTLRDFGVKVSPSQRLRMVTHLHISSDDIVRVINAFSQIK